jgi:hypothetical protein
MNSSDRSLDMRNATSVDDQTAISKASYHGKAAEDQSMNMVDGPKKLAVLSVVKSLSTFDQEEARETIRRKRFKPRRQSGEDMANITQDLFSRNVRPYLPRDDSVFLLKLKTTNAIPMIVPLVTSSDVVPVEGRPLSRIQRRSKPRRWSGAAVRDETRPVVVRDDSLVLAKQKLAGMVPLTYEYEELLTPAMVKNGEETTVEDGETIPVEEPKKKAAATAKAAATKAVPRRTRSQKQKGFVRQNSLTPPSA